LYITCLYVYITYIYVDVSVTHSFVYITIYLCKHNYIFM
jgi:hypothetical protein